MIDEYSSKHTPSSHTKNAPVEELSQNMPMLFKGATLGALIGVGICLVLGEVVSGTIYSVLVGTGGLGIVIFMSFLGGAIAFNWKDNSN